MATIDDDGTPLYKLDGQTYRADELVLVKRDGYFDIVRRSDGKAVETTNLKLKGVEAPE